MRWTRATGRRVPGALLLCASLSMSVPGCDYVLGVERRAPFPGGEAQSVRTALEGDPSLATTVPRKLGASITFGSDETQAVYYCERAGVTANVVVTRNSVRVSIDKLNSRPKPDEVREWTGHVESICSHLTTNVPGIGRWETHDRLDPPPVWILFLAFVGGTVALALWQDRRTRRRLARERAAAANGAGAPARTAVGGPPGDAR